MLNMSQHASMILLFCCSIIIAMITSNVFGVDHNVISAAPGAAAVEPRFVDQACTIEFLSRHLTSLPLFRSALEKDMAAASTMLLPMILPALSLGHAAAETNHDSAVATTTTTTDDSSYSTLFGIVAAMAAVGSCVAWFQTAAPLLLLPVDNNKHARQDTLTNLHLLDNSYDNDDDDVFESNDIIEYDNGPSPCEPVTICDGTTAEHDVQLRREATRPLRLDNNNNHQPAPFQDPNDSFRAMRRVKDEEYKSAAMSKSPTRLYSPKKTDLLSAEYPRSGPIIVMEKQQLRYFQAARDRWESRPRRTIKPIVVVPVAATIVPAISLHHEALATSLLVAVETARVYGPAQTDAPEQSPATGIEATPAPSSLYQAISDLAANDKANDTKQQQQSSPSLLEEEITLVEAKEIAITHVQTASIKEEAVEEATAPLLTSIQRAVNILEASDEAPAHPLDSATNLDESQLLAAPSPKRKRRVLKEAAKVNTKRRPCLKWKRPRCYPTKSGGRGRLARTTARRMTGNVEMLRTMEQVQNVVVDRSGFFLDMAHEPGDGYFDNSVLSDITPITAVIAIKAIVSDENFPPELYDIVFDDEMDLLEYNGDSIDDDDDGDDSLSDASIAAVHPPTSKLQDSFADDSSIYTSNELLDPEFVDEIQMLLENADDDDSIGACFW